MKRIALFVLAISSLVSLTSERLEAQEEKRKIAILALKINTTLEKGIGKTLAAGGAAATLAGLAHRDSLAANEEYKGTATWQDSKDAFETKALGAGLPDELPIHLVTIQAFEMTMTEVTVAQYPVCVTANECTAPNQCDSFSNWEVDEREGHPVNCVTWQQAVSFCEFIGGRLPSEAEWEYAARDDGKDITYPWGNETATCDYAIMNQLGFGCGKFRTWAVCSKMAGNTTTHELCDMAGNVWEWTQDWHHTTYDGAPTNGSAWESPPGSRRILRGGGFGNDSSDDLRSSNRNHDSPSSTDGDLGFRCAK